MTACLNEFITQTCSWEGLILSVSQVFVTPTNLRAPGHPARPFISLTRFFFLSRLGSAWVYFHKLWLKVVSQTEVWRRFRIPVKRKKACVCVFMCVCVCVVRASTYVRRINHDRLICPRVTEGKTKCTAEMSSIGLARQKTFSPCVIRVVQSKPSRWHTSNRESSKWSLKKKCRI